MTRFFSPIAGRLYWSERSPDVLGWASTLDLKHPIGLLPPFERNLRTSVLGGWDAAEFGQSGLPKSGPPDSASSGPLFRCFVPFGS